MKRTAYERDLATTLASLAEECRKTHTIPLICLIGDPLGGSTVMHVVNHEMFGFQSVVEELEAAARQGRERLGDK